MNEKSINDFTKEFMEVIGKGHEICMIYATVSFVDKFANVIHHDDGSWKKYWNNRDKEQKGASLFNYPMTVLPNSSKSPADFWIASREKENKTDAEKLKEMHGKDCKKCYPEKECEHTPSGEGCLVYHQHGRQCVKCAKCGKWSSEWKIEANRGIGDPCKKCGSRGIVCECPPTGLYFNSDKSFRFEIGQPRFGVLQTPTHKEINFPDGSTRIVYELSEVANLMERAHKHFEEVLPYSEFRVMKREGYFDVIEGELSVDWIRIFRELPKMIEEIPKEKI